MPSFCVYIPTNWSKQSVYTILLLTLFSDRPEQIVTSVRTSDFVGNWTAGVAEAAEAGNATTMIMASQTAVGNMTGVEFMGVQHSESGSISQINDTAYTLELNYVSDKAILFSDRPERIVDSVITSDFVGNWTTGQDSFAADAPNAVLVVDEKAVQQEPTIVELFNPVYDVDKTTLSYEITPDNATSIDLPSEFGKIIYSLILLVIMD